MNDQPAQDIARRDEVLELLYWIEGEGFGGAATLDALTRFLAHSSEQVRATLAELVLRGDVVETPETSEYHLTETGRSEAARRFAEEFASLLSQGHGECNDPHCGCHADPSAAAECHAARRHRS